MIKNDKRITVQCLCCGKLVHIREQDIDTQRIKDGKESSSKPCPNCSCKNYIGIKGRG